MGLASFLLTIQIPLPSSLFSRGDMAMVAFAGGTLGCKAVVGCEEYPQELCKDLPGLNGPIWSVCAVDISQSSYFSKLIKTIPDHLPPASRLLEKSRMQLGPFLLLLKISKTTLRRWAYRAVQESYHGYVSCDFKIGSARRTPLNWLHFTQLQLVALTVSFHYMHLSFHHKFIFV